MQKLMTMFLILLTVVSCRSDFPRIKPQLTCSAVFTEVELSPNTYKIDCRCAEYDYEKTKYITEFVKADIYQCDRAHVVPREVFEEEVEPYIDEVREWVEDELKEQKSLEALKSLQENNFNPNY